jgi:tryptophanyl-tRNA synthetase
LAVAKLGPVGAEMTRLKSDHAYIDGVLKHGAERARALARPNMEAVKDIVGFLR